MIRLQATLNAWGLKSNVPGCGGQDNQGRDFGKPSVGPGSGATERIEPSHRRMAADSKVRPGSGHAWLPQLAPNHLVSIESLFTCDGDHCQVARGWSLLDSARCDQSITKELLPASSNSSKAIIAI